MAIARQDLALALAVDCSGSMYQMMPALRGTIAKIHVFVRTLRAKVIIWGFTDEQPHLVVSFGALPAQVPDLLDKGLQPRGGTHYAPVIKRAAADLAEVDASRRLIVLITDGQPGDAKDAAAAIAALKGTEIYCVAFGLHLDAEMMSSLHTLFGARVARASDENGAEFIVRQLIG